MFAALWGEEMKWLLVILVLAFSGATHAETRIIDGDSLELDGRPIRLFAIDLPERGQPGARAATDNLRRMISGKRVACQRIDVDRYRRDVSLCSAGGVDLSLAQVRFGHAVVWCYYVRRNLPAMLATFQWAEAEAKRERLNAFKDGTHFLTAAVKICFGANYQASLERDAARMGRVPPARARAADRPCIR